MLDLHLIIDDIENFSKIPMGSFYKLNFPLKSQIIHKSSGIKNFYMHPVQKSEIHVRDFNQQ